MIDKEKLRYDLSLASAVVMTLRRLNETRGGNPPDLLLDDFLNAYNQYGDSRRDEKLKSFVEKIAESK